MTSWKVRKYGDIEVFYTSGLDGGGDRFGRDFIPVVRNLVGRRQRIFEFCAGPGFIGFNLLANGLCETLAMSDVNPAAVEALRATVAHNGLEDRVTVYQSDSLEAIPPHEICDVFVSNPPHFECIDPNRPSLITDDPGWAAHRAFYSQVGPHLAPGGSVIFQENAEGSEPETFLPMLAEGGLCMRQTLTYQDGTSDPTMYYLWSQADAPGLKIVDRPWNVDIALADPPRLINMSARATYSTLRLENHTERTIQPVLAHEVRGPVLWLPPSPIAPRGNRELPRLQLANGEYSIRDGVQGPVLARLAVARS